MIREMTQQDSSQVIQIYKYGLETRNATFETELPSWSDWDIKHLKHSRYVYEDTGKILGWIALSPVSTRQAYEGVAEISVYADPSSLRKGIGSALMHAVILSSEENGIWTLCSSIFPENKATLRLHEKFGFRAVGYREKIAKLDDKWKNTLLLERRSKKTGI
jgi:L-amino acid N-acyltransferase YncA